MARVVELFVVGRLVRAALFLVLLVAASPARAKDCSEKDLATFRALPGSCKQAEQNLARFVRCVVPPDEKTNLEITLTRNRQLVCCRNAEQTLTSSLHEIPEDCGGKFERLLTAESVLACPGPETAQRVEPLRVAVGACACSDGASAEYQPASAETCEDARAAEHRAGLWMRCNTQRARASEAWKAATAQRQQLCRQVSEPQRRLPRSLSMRELFDQAWLDLKAINEKINGNLQCREPDKCTEDRQLQLQRLALYLAFFQTPSIITPEDQAQARVLTVNVGLPPDPLDYTARCGAPGTEAAMCSNQDLKGSAALWSVLRSKGPRSRELVERFFTAAEKWPDKDKILGTLQELGRLIEQGSPPEVIAEKLRNVPPEARSELFSESLALDARSAWRLRNERELSRLDVIVGMPEDKGQCSEFINGVLADIIGTNPIREPSYSSSFNDDMRSLVARRSAICRFAIPSKESDAAARSNTRASLGCGPVIGIVVDSQKGGFIDSHAVLHLVEPGGENVDNTPERHFGDDPAGQRVGVAQTLDDIRMLYDDLRRPPTALPPRPGTAAEHCGVKIIGEGTPVWPPPKGLAIKLERGWGGPAEAMSHFLKGITTEIAAAGGMITEAGHRLVFDVSAKDKDKYRVSVELWGTTRLYSIAMVVDAASKICANDSETREVADRWRVAGAKAARGVVSYLNAVLVDVPTTNQRVARLLLPGAEWWSAKQPTKVAGGIAWSVGDIGLFGGGAVFLAVAINERNQFAQRNGSLDRANTFQYVGFSLLGTFLVERAVWALIGPEK